VHVGVDRNVVFRQVVVYETPEGVVEHALLLQRHAGAPDDPAKDRSVGDKKTVVFETGLNNLTQDEATVLVPAVPTASRQYYGNQRKTPAARTTFWPSADPGVEVNTMPVHVDARHFLQQKLTSSCIEVPWARNYDLGDLT
jgi:hypothetical protein